MKTVRVVVLLVALLSLVVGCRPSDAIDDAQADIRGFITEAGTSPVLPSPPPPTGPLDAAVAYLAAELGISPEEVTVLSSEGVEWSDTSLGCPEPGMMYAQVITPGYLVLLEAGGREYEVHTDETGRNVVLCQPIPHHLSDQAPAFRALLAYLIQAYPGFGLEQRAEWVQEDLTPPGLVGASTQVWRSEEWYLQMSCPVVPHPACQTVLSHRRAGVVWAGTLEADWQVTPADESLTMSFDVGLCDEATPLDALGEWAGVEVTVQGRTIHIEQNLSYVCCAELALAAGREGAVLKVIETNVGQVCRCVCGYPVAADLTGLPAGTYTVEVWGVQYFDVHPLELLGRAEVTVP